MEMDVAIQGVAETLDKRDRAALLIPESHEFSCTVTQMTQHCSCKYIRDITHEPPSRRIL
jgi:hypothetical protein